MGDIYQQRYNSRSRLARIFIRSHGVLFSYRHNLESKVVADKVTELFALFSEFNAEFGVKLPDNKRWSDIEKCFSDAVKF